MGKVAIEVTLTGAWCALCEGPIWATDWMFCDWCAPSTVDEPVLSEIVGQLNQEQKRALAVMLRFADDRTDVDVMYDEARKWVAA